MAYQPNPFVNPNQRGVDLPPGCKDLNDVLTRAGMEAQCVIPSRVETGGLSEVRSYVCRLYQAKSRRQVLLVIHSASGAWLVLSYVEGGFRLSLLLHRGSSFLEEAIVELFGREALPAATSGDFLRTVHVP